MKLHKKKLHKNRRGNMAYHLEGRLLEVCNCRVLCPCWIGEDPDFGTCDTIVAWHFDKGTIDGVDVSDRTIAMIAHIPGNILQGNWRAAVFLDGRVSTEQEHAIPAEYTGQNRGPFEAREAGPRSRYHGPQRAAEYVRIPRRAMDRVGPQAWPPRDRLRRHLGREPKAKSVARCPLPCWRCSWWSRGQCFGCGARAS